MFEWVIVLLTKWLDMAQDKLEGLIDLAEWYTHSEDIRVCREGDWLCSESFLGNDDDGDELDHYEYYFDEYDWETERDDRG